MKRLTKTLGALVLALAGCGQKAPKQESPEAKEKLEREYIVEYGYGINPQTKTDSLVMGIYSKEIPKVNILTQEGDTLENLSEILHNDKNKWEDLINRNIVELRNYNAKDSLPAGLKIKTYMFGFQLERYRQKFPERKVEIATEN